jgi:hypothetical protein
MAKSVKDIEKAIAALPKDQLMEFRAWYENFDADAWDKQINNDAVGGRLDALAEAALANHKAGKSTRL